MAVVSVEEKAGNIEDRRPEINFWNVQNSKKLENAAPDFYCWYHLRGCHAPGGTDPLGHLTGIPPQSRWRPSIRQSTDVFVGALNTRTV